MFTDEGMLRRHAQHRWDGSSSCPAFRCVSAWEWPTWPTPPSRRSVRQIADLPAHGSVLCRRRALCSAYIYDLKVFGNQTGLLNGIWMGLGGDPVAWLSSEPWNNLMLMVIMIWLQTGFAMVILSAAIKAVPDDILEAARIDGATEIQIFWRVIIPSIMSSIVVVSTTMVISVLKIFDIVWVMTNGQFGTEVIAERMVRWFFRNDHNGRGAAIAVVLFLAIVPVMYINVRRFRGRGGDAMTATTSRVETAEEIQFRQKGFFSRLWDRWPVKLVVFLIVFIWLVPTIGLLVSSFRNPNLVSTTGWWTAIPNLFDSGQWTLDNYKNVLESEGFGNAFLNSIAVSVPATVIPITIAAFAAYAFLLDGVPGRQVMFVVVVGLLVVPLQMALIPILKLYSQGIAIGGFTIFPDLDLNGTYMAVWLAHTGFGLPLATYLLRNYIGSLPASTIESAQIDGADHFTIFRKLIVPLSVPALASFAIFQFLWVWNDFLVALVFLGGTKDVRVLTQALAELNGTRGEAWHLLTSGAFLTMVLPLAVFFSLQRYFVRGLTAGSVKG